MWSRSTAKNVLVVYIRSSMCTITLSLTSVVLEASGGKFYGDNIPAHINLLLGEDMHCTRILLTYSASLHVGLCYFVKLDNISEV